jgi:hypothetical protein
MSAFAPARVTDLLDRIHQELDSGNITAGQVAIGLHGEVVLFEAFGAATTDDRLVIYSATKPLVAMALLPHLADAAPSSPNGRWPGRPAPVPSTTRSPPTG